jgi:hypothetical protein
LIFIGVTAEHMVVDGCRALGAPGTAKLADQGAGGGSGRSPARGGGSASDQVQFLGGQHSGHFTRNVILYRFITTFGRFNTKNDENAFLYVDLNEGKFMFQRSNLY